MSSNTLPREDCPFCTWRGPNNKYAKHLTECEKKDAGQDSRAGTAEATLTDGGARPEPSAGMLVYDRDEDAQRRSTALVLDTVNVPAEQYVIPDADCQTVAELNPHYPARAHVAVVAFTDDLDDVLGDYRRYSLSRLREHTRSSEIRAYSYPKPRLEPVDGEKPDVPGGVTP